MPQGGIDEGEDPRATALRELAEEIGTNNATMLAESREWLSYDLPNHLVPTVWDGKFRGQMQKWFCMRFEGTDAEINLNTPHPEFCAWQWVMPHMLPDLIVPFKRNLYSKVLVEFEEYLVTNS